MNALRTLAAALFALVIVLAPQAAFAATGAGQTSVTLLRSLSMVRTADLEFGALVPSAISGTATINASTDLRSTSGGVVGASGGATGAAKFTAAGAVGVIAIFLPPSTITISNGSGGTMTIDAITLNGASDRIFPLGGTIDVALGGRLTVAANQPEGSYSGTFALTVLYL